MDNDPSSASRRSFNFETFPFTVERVTRKEKHPGEKNEREKVAKGVAKAEEDAEARTTAIRSPGSRPSDKGKEWPEGLGTKKDKRKKWREREATRDTEDERLASGMRPARNEVSWAHGVLERLQT